MNEFDDRELGDALRRRAGAPTDGFGIEAAHSAVVARAGRVRRRRAAVAGGAAMAGLVALAVFVIGPGSDSVVTTPADQTDAPAPSVDSSVDTTTPASTAPDETEPDQDVTVTTTPTPTSLAPTTTAAAEIPPPATASTTTAPSTTAPAATTTVVAPPTSPPPTAPTTTVAPAPDPITQTYSSAGGSITLRWDGAALTLLDVTPAAGFGSEVEDERPDRIRVRFEGDGDFRIEIRVVDGQIVRVE